MVDIQAIERCALAAWPAAEVVETHGWLLRYAHGVTRRANSTWPNGAPDDGWTAVAVDDALARVGAFYRARRLPPRLQITPAALPDGLDALLAARGYVAEAPTAVQTAPVAVVSAQSGAPRAARSASSTPSRPPGWTATRT